jgi:Mn2+/Fe2+ NRAMP family transporter
VLRYLLLGFLAFGAAAILARPDWPQLLRHSVRPALSLRSAYVAGGLALLGTTLTSYAYVWETIGRGVEEPRAGSAGGELARARIGAIVGPAFTAVILWFMLIASAATLGRHHHAVASAHDAARALRPIAGSLAADLYAAGLVISAVVALPIPRLWGSTAGAHADERGHWRPRDSERTGCCQAVRGVLFLCVVAAVALAARTAAVSAVMS